MKVRAIKKGYYGLMLREPGMPGSEFTLKDEADFSSKWMERMPDKTRKDVVEEEQEQQVEQEDKKEKANPKHGKGNRHDKSVI